MKPDLLKDKLNIVLDKKKLQDFEKFIELFVEYNSHTNLMSKNDLSLIFEKHIFDSLAFNLFYKKYSFKDDLKLLDIGTGGGFPSVPLALYFKNINITAVDSINKKIEFIRQVKSEFTLGNLNPICKRIEELEGKASFDIVTTRALSSLNVALEYAIPYVKVGGYFVAYKSKNVDDEINNSKNALKILGAKIVDKIEYKLPLEDDFTRVLIVIKKEKSTPLSYPRKSGLIKKSPL